MSGDCGCGTDGGAGQRFGCIECGTTCCTACAVHLESVMYCGSCAGSLLDSTVVRPGGSFDLH
ncbi:MAG: hypothetical protein ACREJG_11690 [Candidatus Rokuibacteriota bacterium]